MSRLNLNTLRLLKEMIVYLGVPLLLAMAIHANTIAAHQSRETESLVASQTTILKAIKQVTTDNKTDNIAKTNTIICMLQVPVEERTTDVLNNCRKQADGTTTTQLLPAYSPPKVTGVTTPPSTSATSPSSSSPSSPPSSPSPSRPGLLKQITNFLGL